MYKDVIKFLALMQTISGEYLSDDYYIMDPEVNDCLIKMYFVMMVEKGHPDYERLYSKFLTSYHSLNEEKQEIVKNDLKKIIEAQDEHKKVKRKGEI